MITPTCSIIKWTTSEELVEQTYALVGAKAIDYEKRPDNSDSSTDLTVKGTRNIPNSLLMN